jgi:disulfide bond formation protein DsbB
VVETMQVLTSLCALAAGLGAVLLVVARLLSPVSPLAHRLGSTVWAARAPLTLVVAGGAMLGSLYFSEVAHYTPCRLCWFQRIAMYPIAVVALVAIVRRDRSARWYFLPMAVVGAGISTWHYLVEWFPKLEGDSCGLVGPSCSDLWFRRFGFVSLAFMALCGFVAIIVFNTVSFRAVQRKEAT